MNWWPIQTALTTWTASTPGSGSKFLALDADTGRDLESKPQLMRSRAIQTLRQVEQLKNPDARIALTQMLPGALLSAVADYGKGSTTGDRPRFLICFWEISEFKKTIKNG
jgi:hypothetical protein